jgi:hypothetical protein
MGRIVFLNPSPKELISGGMKTVYRHAEMLTELGFEACIFQPDGKPDWLRTSASVLTAVPYPLRDEILVIPENATGWVADLALNATSVQRVLFCQNQYYMFDSDVPPERFRTAGFSRIICPGEIARGFLSRVFHLDDIAVVPYHIDPELFFPRMKSARVVVMPHKLPRQAVLLQSALRAKYPRLKSVPWGAIDNTTEEQTAELLGRSTVYLSLSSMESFGLVPLEAMASHCIVVGFHGYGGMEYASPENGYWFSPDQIEEVVDALASVLDGIERGDKALDAMRIAGLKTVARYPRAETKAALARAYGALVARSRG